MATASSTTSGKAKSANGSGATGETSGSRSTSPKSAGPKRRTAARPKSASARAASAVSSLKVPQWVTIGASVTGAVVAVGATLFATRNEWLPRAKKLGAWVENTVQDQVDNLAAARSKTVETNEPEAPTVGVTTSGIQ